MSKKGCSPDNSACEGVFGRLKNEMFYYVFRAGYAINQFINAVDQYLHTNVSMCTVVESGPLYQIGC